MVKDAVSVGEVDTVSEDDTVGVLEPDPDTVQLRESVNELEAVV